MHKTFSRFAVIWAGLQRSCLRLLQPHLCSFTRANFVGTQPFPVSGCLQLQASRLYTGVPATGKRFLRMAEASGFRAQGFV